MFSHIFINRPIFASVISIVIVILGLIALLALPVSRYPELAPPTINVTAFYPGADAKTVAETVATPLELEINGVENMIYMSSVSSNDGNCSITVTFAPGTNLDTANVLVQNRVSVATAKLPEEVKRTGVTVKKRSTDTAGFVAFYSPDGRYDDLFLSNYMTLRIKDEIARVPGVGDVFVYGTGDYSMRIWLDPEKMKVRKVTVTDVMNAVRAQNVQVAAGKIGGEPAPVGQAFEYTVNIRGRLLTTDEFENIIIRTSESGAVLRIRDIGRVELGSKTYTFSSTFRGQPAATIAIYQIPGENLLNTMAGIRKKLEELEPSFPEGFAYELVYDATEVVTASIQEVITTLLITLVLVVLTVYMFLQSFRATLVPAVTIPVSLVGTFFMMSFMGYSINTLTMFGLVLVIGIVVDDAIVVVENCTRLMDDEGLSPKDAAKKTMIEVTGPVIATTLVLLAVFVPTIFLQGITGTMFKQFGVTISIAVVFSSINALTLSPALCGVLLKPSSKKLPGPFVWFNKTLEGTTNVYAGIVEKVIRLSVIAVVVFAGLVVAAVMGFTSLPTGFVPQEDEGFTMAVYQLPNGSSIQRTREVALEVDSVVGQTPGVRSWLNITGFSILDGSAAANAGFAVVAFDNWKERPDIHQDQIIQSINARLFGLREATAFAFPMPSLPGIGISGGFTMMLQDRGGVGLQQLQQVGREMIEDGNAQTGLQGLNSPFRANNPQLFIDLDREQLQNMGISPQEVFTALQANLGQIYINDFTYFGRIFQVNMQADGQYRATADQIRNLEIRNRNGDMVPLGAVITIEEIFGPQSVTRFNAYPAMKILGNAAPGYSSGQALEIMESMAAQKLPASMGFAWSELSYQEKQASGGGMTFVLIFAVVMVYLVLSAQYESWTIPISVVLSVPTALLGAVIAALLREFDNNVYTQIGIVLLIGLSTKSAILIVEFAKVQRESGLSIFDAAITALKIRFRAVLMTAFSFILGVLPLMVASGAGAESRKILGTIVFGGMVVATVVSLCVVPMLYYVIQSIQEKLFPSKPAAEKPVPPADPDPEPAEA